MSRAPSKCAWLMRGRKESCGKRCYGEYCGQHNYQLKKGMKMPEPRRGCGVGLLCEYRLCKPCGGSALKHRLIGKRAKKQIREKWQRGYTAQDAMSVVDRSFEQSLEEELPKMDPKTLQFLEQLLAENLPAARKAVQNALDESISQDGRKRVEMAVARLDQEYLKYLRDKAAKKLRKEVIMEVRTEAQNGVKKYIQEILDENFNKMEIIEKHYPNIVVKKLWAFGWADAHKELAEAPYCEKQGQITKVFKCPKCNTCKLTGLCVACYKHAEEYHTLVGREEVAELEEKKFVKTWGQTELLSEINEQFKEGCKYDKEREKDVIRMAEQIRIAGLKQSLEQRAAGCEKLILHV